jgi:hypothetical protein
VTLTEFLLVRIDEDDEPAAGILPGVAMGVRARSDPGAASAGSRARVLAECEAKRRIVQLHEGATAYDGVRTTAPSAQTLTAPGWIRTSNRCRATTLRLLALPYADHPDWAIGSMDVARPD